MFDTKDKERRIREYVKACENGHFSVSRVYKNPSANKMDWDNRLWEYYIDNDTEDRYTGYRIIAHNTSQFTVGVLDEISKLLIVITKDNVYHYQLTADEWENVFWAYVLTNFF